MLTAPAVQLASSSRHQHQGPELHVQPECPGAELCVQPGGLLLNMKLLLLLQLLLLLPRSTDKTRAAAAEQHRQQRAAVAAQRAAAAEQHRQDRAAAAEQRRQDRQAATDQRRQAKARAASLHNLGRQQLDCFEEEVFQHSKLQKLTDLKTKRLSISLMLK